MPYRKDPLKKLAQQLNEGLNRGHRWAVIWVINDRLQMTGTNHESLRVWSAWNPGTELVDIKERLAQLPRVSC